MEINWLSRHEFCVWSSISRSVMGKSRLQCNGVPIQGSTALSSPATHYSRTLLVNRKKLITTASSKARNVKSANAIRRYIEYTQDCCPVSCFSYTTTLPRTSHRRFRQLRAYSHPTGTASRQCIRVGFIIPIRPAIPHLVWHVLGDAPDILQVDDLVTNMPRVVEPGE